MGRGSTPRGSTRFVTRRPSTTAVISGIRGFRGVYGTVSDLERLSDDCHERGIRPPVDPVVAEYPRVVGPAIIGDRTDPGVPSVVPPQHDV